MFGCHATHVQVSKVVKELHIMFHIVLSPAGVELSTDCKALAETLHKRASVEESKGGNVTFMSSNCVLARYR